VGLGGIFKRATTAFALRKCKSIGEGVMLEGSPRLMCWPDVRIRIGDRFRLSSIPEVSHFMVFAAAEVQIGNDVWIGHGASIAATQRVTIGDGTKIGPFVTIMDTDFHVAGERAANPLSTPIEIGKNVYIGSGVTILRGSVVGDGARIEPCSVVSGVVPAGVTVSGVPARARPAVGRENRRDVVDVLTQTFALAAPPSPDDGPLTIRGWDSLGALRLLLALEDAFDVSIAQDEMVRVRSVRDLEALVDRSPERAAALA
jgi:acetyltransferase-like isoleucine patch superfamily enzyme/acyl carrier protein